MPINFRVCLSLFIYTPCLIILFASCATWPVLFNLFGLGKFYKKLQLNYIRKYGRNSSYSYLHRVLSGVVKYCQFELFIAYLVTSY